MLTASSCVFWIHRFCCSNTVLWGGQQNTSIGKRMTVNGVFSSWEASATNCFAVPTLFPPDVQPTRKGKTDYKQRNQCTASNQHRRKQEGFHRKVYSCVRSTKAIHLLPLMFLSIYRNPKPGRVPLSLRFLQFFCVAAFPAWVTVSSLTFRLSLLVGDQFSITVDHCTKGKRKRKIPPLPFCSKSNLGTGLFPPSSKYRSMTFMLSITSFFSCWHTLPQNNQKHCSKSSSILIWDKFFPANVWSFMHFPPDDSPFAHRCYPWMRAQVEKNFCAKRRYRPLHYYLLRWNRRFPTPWRSVLPWKQFPLDFASRIFSTSNSFKTQADRLILVPQCRVRRKVLKVRSRQVMSSSWTSLPVWGKC